MSGWCEYGFSPGEGQEAGNFIELFFKNEIEMNNRKSLFYQHIPGIPPTIEDVKVYFAQKGLSALEAEHFFILYEARGWRTRNGALVRKWKTVAYRWVLSAWLWNPLLFERRT